MQWPTSGPPIEQLEDVDVRWFFRTPKANGSGAPWEPLCGHDSLKIEKAYRSWTSAQLDAVRASFYTHDTTTTTTTTTTAITTTAATSSRTDTDTATTTSFATTTTKTTTIKPDATNVSPDPPCRETDAMVVKGQEEEHNKIIGEVHETELGLETELGTDLETETETETNLESEAKTSSAAGIPILGGLYEANVVQRRARPVFWNDDAGALYLLRGTWFFSTGSSRSRKYSTTSAASSSSALLLGGGQQQQQQQKQ